MNPGRNSKNYHDIYNLRNYFNFYYLYCEREDKENRILNKDNENEESLLNNFNKFIDAKMKQNFTSVTNTEQSCIESSTVKTTKYSEAPNLGIFKKENENLKILDDIKINFNSNYNENNNNGLLGK